MFGIFGGHGRSDQNEQLLLVSEAVKSGLSLAEAIRLTADNGPVGRSFLRFADLLDQGFLPGEAVRQSGFASEIRNVLSDSLENPCFADSFALQTRLYQFRRQMRIRLINALAYPAFLFISVLVVFYFLFFFIVPQLTTVYDDFGTELPANTQMLILFGKLMVHGGFYIALLLFILIMILFSKTIFLRLFYRIPFFGTLRLKIFQCGLLRMIAFSLRREIPLPVILKSLADRTGCRAFKNDLRRAGERAEQGERVGDLVLDFPWLFPVWLAPLLNSNNGREAQADSFEDASKTIEKQSECIMSFAQTFSLVFALVFIFIAAILTLLGLIMPMIRLCGCLSL